MKCCSCGSSSQNLIDFRDYGLICQPCYSFHSGDIRELSFYITSSQRHALLDLASSFGFFVNRGKDAGSPSISKFIKAIASGDITCIPSE